MDALTPERLAALGLPPEEAREALQTQDALEFAERVLREAVEDFEGHRYTVQAEARHNDFGRAIDKLRKVLGWPEYIGPRERDSEASAEAQRWGE